jgi:hypothetical protein
MENSQIEEKVSEEALTYIVLLSAMQVVVNCSTELKGTKYYSSKVKQKCTEAINTLMHFNTKNHKIIWEIDSEASAKIMYGIQAIGEQLAVGGVESLGVIADLTRKGYDFSKYKLVEIEESEIDK